MTDEKFVPGEWYPIDTLPAEYRKSEGEFGYSKPFRARCGEWAPYDAWIRNGRFEPIGHGSYHPTHWSPKEIWCEKT